MILVAMATISVGTYVSQLFSFVLDILFVITQGLTEKQIIVTLHIAHGI